MYITMMKSKIHRATVTEADLNYIGSITIDEDILDSVGILPNEKVQIVNIHNGARMETYVITGERGTGVVCLNGAAARLVQKEDKIIIIAYADMKEEEAINWKPHIAVMDNNNKVLKELSKELHLTKI